jgi:hypothetical protein
MKEELNRSRVTPDSFWQNSWRFGDGYNAMAHAERRRWHAIPSWGRDGYDLGSWPYVIVFFRNREDTVDVVEYVEGDSTQWSCPTREIRQAITDELAFFHWKHNDEEWVKGYDSVDQLPDELRGPSRSQ